MSLLFDPLYPTVVQYVVSQSIWELYEIHFWNVLFGIWGKNRAFVTLQNRYEKKQYEGTALAFLVIVFAITYLIQWLMALRQQTEEAAVAPNDGNDDNQNQPNGDNDAIDERNLSAGNQRPDPQHDQ